MVRAVLLVLGVWGVLFGLGMLAAVTVHPHVVGPDGVRVRSGTALDLHLPWVAIAQTSTWSACTPTTPPGS